MRSIHKGLLVSLATFALLFVLFGVAELLVRYFVPADPGLDPRHLEAMLWAAGPCYRIERSSEEPELVEVRPSDPRFVNRRTSVPMRFPLAKRPEVTRVVVIGESSANMMENTLASLVEQPACVGHYEVLECSVPGGDLQQIERRFEYALDYDPDVIIVIFGHNLYFSNQSDPVVLRVQWWQSHSRLLTYLASRIHPAAPPRFANPADALPALDAALHRFAAEAAARHVALVLNTMASNLWWHPSGSNDGQDENRPERLEALLQYDLGHRDEAIVALRRLVDEHPSAIFEFQLADWLYQRGDYAEARRRFDHARDIDEMRFRASTAINEHIRAAARPPVILRDTEQALAESAPHGIPGWESFLDNCHLSTGLDAEGVALLATLPGAEPCARVMSESRERQTFDNSLNGLIAQAAASTGARAAAWWANLPYFVADALARYGPDAVHWLDEDITADGFTRLDPAKQSEALTAIAEGFWRAGQRDRAAELNERARAQPAAASAWVQRGRWWVRLGRSAEALAAFETALQAVPSQRDAAYFAQRLKTLSSATQ